MKPGAVLRIARWELTSGAGGLDRRASIMALAAVLLLVALVPAVMSVGATAPDTGIYRAGIPSSSPYHPAVADDPRFVIVGPDLDALRGGEIEVVVRDGRLYGVDTQKGRSAADAFRAAVEAYNDRLMRSEPDQAAAFPVSVQVSYVERDVDLTLQRDGNAGVGPDTVTPIEPDTAESTDPRPDDGSDASATAAEEPPAQGGRGAVPANALFGRTTGSPSDISPPFPFVSLVLAFAFVVPMNFVIQAYASSILGERTNRRGELMLVAPVSRWTIIAGKTLPYFAVMLLIAGATAIAIGGGVVSIVAVTPIALLFLSCAFLGALLARSHKELTFVLVTVSVVVTTYAFVPAIFTQIHPIAAISPLTLVVRDLEGARIAIGTIAFSTVPVAVSAGVLFALGAGLYREEDLFTQLPLPAKAVDALAGPITGRRSAALLSMLSIPFVFLAELLLVAVLFVLPIEVGLPVLLVLIAGVEELAKSAHLYAGFARGHYRRSLRTAAVVGVLSGLGFFVAEKVVLAAQLVGLMELELGRAAFELGAGTGGPDAPIVLAGLLLAPLALHCVTATVGAVGASRGRSWYAPGLAVAILVHALYNLVVVMQVG